MLQWQIRAARRAAARLSQMGSWLQDRARLCRYAHVPLSNLGHDPAVAVADMLLARSLRDSQNVLWVRDPSLPDLGGCMVWSGGPPALSPAPFSVATSLNP